MVVSSISVEYSSHYGNQEDQQRTSSSKSRNNNRTPIGSCYKHISKTMQLCSLKDFISFYLQNCIQLFSNEICIQMSNTWHTLPPNCNIWTLSLIFRHSTDSEIINIGLHKLLIYKQGDPRANYRWASWSSVVIGSSSRSQGNCQWLKRIIYRILTWNWN